MRTVDSVRESHTNTVQPPVVKWREEPERERERERDRERKRQIEPVTGNGMIPVRRLLYLNPNRDMDMKL